MRKHIRWFAMVIVVSLFCVSDSSFAQQSETLNRAVDWLAAQQDETGAFKSKHYGAMKQGAAMTSLALYALSTAPEECREKHRKVIDKSFEFLLPGTKARGRVANPDGSLDHTVYSTAMFLVAAHRLEYDIDQDLLLTLVDFLIKSQCTGYRGFESDNPNYGGWDVIGPDVMAGKTSGANVSVTRFVLEALNVGKMIPSSQPRQRPLSNRNPRLKNGYVDLKTKVLMVGSSLLLSLDQRSTRPRRKKGRPKLTRRPHATVAWRRTTLVTAIGMTKISAMLKCGSKNMLRQQKFLGSRMANKMAGQRRCTFIICKVWPGLPNV